MNYTVYEGRVPVGELSIEPAGLYYEIRCKLNKTDAVRRTRTGEPQLNVSIPAPFVRLQPYKEIHRYKSGPLPWRLASALLTHHPVSHME